MEYNGWTNWETWSASLWLENTEQDYNTCRAMSSPEEIKQHYEKRCYDKGFGDHREVEKVNWDEVYQSLTSE